MPILTSSNYQRPKWLFNGHLETIYPAVFRKVALIQPEKERILTSDRDFLELDWYRQKSQKLVIISHGLEGNSTRPYMLGMARIFLKNQFDVVTWNYRGCGSELNHQPIFYHSGATYDLDEVVRRSLQDYAEIHLVGFSLGGNLTLKYLGEKQGSLPELRKAVAISVPLDLASSSKKISSPENKLYSERFLKTLREKVIRKAQHFPDAIPAHELRNIKTLADFDDYFTGPLHGFQDSEDYYAQNSSLYFLDKIQIPTLILNAQNDPFLSRECFPSKWVRELDFVYAEYPKYGGHVGFTSVKKGDPYYSERRAFEFISSDL
ncbi:alpha/beta fold hydrolase [Algoriphagus sp.]|uniref:YheT family hydrolase n=1 Tax=Algoriphagus sp. TaxID=1872435 RepID=UPI00261AC30F|nr:alpha/beta fold hydrolase [Algoriphagus sp.]